MKIDHFYYLDPLPQLKHICSDNRDFVEFHKKANLDRLSGAGADKLTSMLQGTVVRRLVLEVDADVVLPITLFFDEIGFSNAIGASASRQKHAVLTWSFAESGGR